MACANSATDKKIVCYFRNWALVTNRVGDGKFDIPDIDPNLCTHIVYSGAGLDACANIKSTDPWVDLPYNGGKNGYNRFNKLRLRNPKVKTFISIGSRHQDSIILSAVASDFHRRAIFIENAVDFVKTHGFDGMSLDWLYPNQRGDRPVDKQNYVLLLKELRSRLDSVGLMLMATVGAVHLSSIRQSYDIPEMSQYLDTINLMTYDYHGPWESITGINSPLYSGPDEIGDNKLKSVDKSVKYWLDHGVPARKLIVGIPAFGRSYTLTDQDNNGIGASSSGPGKSQYNRDVIAGFLGHAEIEEFHMRNFTTINYDSTRKAYYAFWKDQWLSFEGPLSIDAKAQMIKDYGLGGAMLYSIDTEDFKGYSGTTFPLLKRINYALKSSDAFNSTPQ